MLRFKNELVHFIQLMSRGEGILICDNIFEILMKETKGRKFEGFIFKNRSSGLY